jgi:tetratricopeptide (TPR) repeat protein
MFRKNYFTFLLAVTLFLVSGIVVFAQNAPVGGRVQLKKADGTTEPVAGALIEVFRTDIKAKFPAAKSDKKGNFAFAGLPLGATFVFSISAPNIKPEIYPNMKAGAQNIVITVNEGDGKRWTEEEVRQALANPTTTVATTAGTSKAELTAEQKKAKEEYDKKVVEVTEKNKKIENSTVIIQRSVKEGDAAYKEKNYDLALTKFDEGINADPDFAGSAPVLLNFKGVVLKDRGYATYAQGVKSTDAAQKKEMLESAKKDWTSAIDNFSNGLKILKGATAADAEAQKNYDISKFNILSNLIEVHRLLSRSGIDTSKSAEAKLAFDDYLAIETDAAKKAKAQITLGDVLREGNDSDNAIIAYKAALVTSPDNPDALAGLGLSLFNAGVVSDNTPQKQEGLNYMQRFAEVAPDNHPLKSSVRDAVEYLKTQDKLAPEKIKTSTKKKP